MRRLGIHLTGRLLLSLDTHHGLPRRGADAAVRRDPNVDARARGKAQELDVGL